MQNIDLIVCGIGGQGNLLVERILGAAAIKIGLEAKAADTFGAAQRGGSVLTHMRISKKVYSCLVSKGHADVVLALEPGEGLMVAPEYLKEDGLLLVNEATVLPPNARTGKGSYPSYKAIKEDLDRLKIKTSSLNATKLAIDKAGDVKAMNVVMLGALIAHNLLPLEADLVREVIQDFSPKFAPMNLKAFEAGREAFLTAE
jgi:indolepyruvate ferredoxin oxidoreductase beta subunit